MGGYVEVWRDGARLTLWMLYVITLLDADLYRMFGVHVLVSSAIRTYADQERIFRQRYVTAANVKGRRVYDTRVWNGVRWYRISSAGTVAVPGTSNHEIQGTKAAVDLRDTGKDAGITVATSARGKWIRKWCRDKGLLIASGDGFREGWHFDVPGIFRTPPTIPSGGGSKPAPTPTPKPEPALLREEEDENMPIIIRNVKTGEVSLLDPDVGQDLPRMVLDGPSQHRSEPEANIYRGVVVFKKPEHGDAVGRSYARQYGNAPQDRQPADYRIAQYEASRLAFEKHS